MPFAVLTLDSKPYYFMAYYLVIESCAYLTEINSYRTQHTTAAEKRRVEKNARNPAY